MSKLTNVLGEYFLGLDTIRFHRNERNFFREFEEDKGQLKKLLIGSYINQGLLISNRFFANLISLVGIAGAIVTKDNSYLLAPVVSESLLRMSSFQHSRRNKLNFEMLKSSYSTREYVNDLLDSGEGWKRGY